MKKSITFIFLWLSCTILAQDSTHVRSPVLIVKTNLFHYIDLFSPRTISLQIEHVIGGRFNLEHETAYLPRIGRNNIKEGFRYRGMLRYYYGKSRKNIEGFSGISFLYQEKTYREADFFSVTQQGDGYSAYQQYGKYDETQEKKALALHAGITIKSGSRFVTELVGGIGRKWFSYRYSNITPNSYIASPKLRRLEIDKLHIMIGLKIGYIIF